MHNTLKQSNRNREHTFHHSKRVLTKKVSRANKTKTKITLEKRNLSATDVFAVAGLQHLTDQQPWAAAEIDFTTKQPAITVTRTTTEAFMEPVITVSKIITSVPTEPYIPPAKTKLPENDITSNNTPAENKVQEVCCKIVSKKGEKSSTCRKPVDTTKNGLKPRKYYDDL